MSENRGVRELLQHLSHITPRPERLHVLFTSQGGATRLSLLAVSTLNLVALEA